MKRYVKDGKRLAKEFDPLTRHEWSGSNNVSREVHPISCKCGHCAWETDSSTETGLKQHITITGEACKSLNIELWSSFPAEGHQYPVQEV
jgi:hypothetical protein